MMYVYRPKVQHKDYPTWPAPVADDPAGYAIEHRLVGEHSEAVRGLIGAWRWPLLTKYANRIVPMLQENERTVDFGGAAGPVGYGTIVVDRVSEVRGFIELPPEQVDVIVSSHTLEHIVNIGLCLSIMCAVLRPGGQLVVFVPSWRAENLRNESWPHHAHTFRLAGDDCDVNAIALDGLLIDAGFVVAHMDEDDRNLIVFAEKPE